ncbi:DegV family protein [Acholeplasma hippikon]|uniref:DegV domain-containing protein SAV1425 n=1 Tax=Acholeplasma hippikon TaxID=264636 RepID=A0A449BLD3_9MOLU|nr:DegV family protein [Acholeplasma hippikon]VEU83248.1 DegV domain-containing protein SAV1425 [Acholeplasma hippikon]
MSNYIITTSSPADLTNEFLNERNIPYVSFTFELNNETYKDDLGKTISADAFYAAMRKGASTKTSQVNAEAYVNFFTPFLEKGLDIIHIELSSGLSGSINSARIAKEILLETFPNRKIALIDSLSASAGLGLLVDKASELQNEGYAYLDLVNYLETNKLKLNHWFYSTDLSYYVKGGRISSTAGFVGSILSLCPVLNVDDNGKLIPKFKVIGKKRAINKVVEQMMDLAKDGINYNGKCFISHADCIEDAKTVASKIEANFPLLNGKVEIFNVGSTIGSHTGPGTLALFFFGENR